MALRTGSNENTNLINRVKEMPPPADFITGSTTTHPPSPSYKHEADGKEEKKNKRHHMSALGEEGAGGRERKQKGQDG